jgi:hypothetical protein
MALGFITWVKYDVTRLVASENVVFNCSLGYESNSAHAVLSRDFLRDQPRLRECNLKCNRFVTRQRRWVYFCFTQDRDSRDTIRHSVLLDGLMAPGYNRQVYLYWLIHTEKYLPFSSHPHSSGLIHLSPSMTRPFLQKHPSWHIAMQAWTIGDLAEAHVLMSHGLPHFL